MSKKGDLLCLYSEKPLTDEEEIFLNYYIYFQEKYVKVFNYLTDFDYLAKEQNTLKKLEYELTGLLLESPLQWLPSPEQTTAGKYPNHLPYFRHKKQIRVIKKKIEVTKFAIAKFQEWIENSHITIKDLEQYYQEENCFIIIGKSLGILKEKPEVITNG